MAKCLGHVYSAAHTVDPRLVIREESMGEAFESIMRGLREGKRKLKTIEIEPAPVNVTEPRPSHAPVSAKHDGTDSDQHER